ncbi:hypothetical protein D0469_12180 [Peribacillus saganii]|uniref:Uncharacterized protein n=1 Tax=Peribacillus saganii TaxID=2303992 RepID=A0A372LND0_9BACI|nr:hypothetical protein [Peribacillus saganii]RFU68489.1 hypothetical protein D0469_12180 [Peribacillus saganii]
MAYLMEKFQLLQHGELKETSMFIKNNEIQTIHISTAKLKFMKMNLEGFVIAPSFCTVAGEIGNGKQDSLMELYVRRGITSIIVPVPICYEFEVKEKVRTFRKKLETSPLDYVLALQIPQRLLTPSIMMYCKSAKIPAVFIEVDQLDALESLAWTWIKQSGFPYSPVLIPLFKEKEFDRGYEKRWVQLMRTVKISSLDSGLVAGEPLGLEQMKKLGIYPKKGDLHAGGEINYNIYLKEAAGDLLNGKHSLIYDKVIGTVSKGKVIRAGETLYLNPGDGREIIVQVPGFFI